MHEVYFSDAKMKLNTLELQGPYFQGIVELVNENVWRIFVWHRLEDAKKGSWTIEKKENTTFEFQDHGSYLTLDADDAIPLTIHKNPFCWQWGKVETNKLIANNQKDCEQMIELATGEGNPFAETNDGLPMGGGYTLSLNESDNRFYYGLGERTGFINKKGRRWQNWNTDISRHVPNTDPLYQAHPFVIGAEQGEFFALYLDESWKTEYDLAFSQPEKSFISTVGPTFDLYLIPGPGPQEIISRYTNLVGRAFMPPLWALGLHQCRWSYPDEKCINAVAKTYRKHDIPLDAMWLDIDYMDGYKVFTFSPHRFPNPKQLTDDLKKEGIRTVVIVDPGVKKEVGYEVYESGSKKDMFVKNRRDEEFVGEVWPQPAVWPDFIQPNVREWWGKWLEVYDKVGIDGIWNDMNEPAAFKLPGKTLPPGTKHGAHWHAEVHNIYGHMMGKATYDALRKISPDKRPFILTRSGFAGIQKYAFVWTGDNSSFWEHLEMSVPMILNMGLSGIPFVGVDIGGFSGNCDGEMLSRWTWLGAFYPFMRNHAGKGSRRQEPWSFGEPYLSIVRQAIRFRYRILPYLYTLVKESHETGLPVMRPLFLEYPQDQNTYLLSDQFLFGKNVLVAPVTRPGQTNRMVYFPKGRWQHLFTQKIYQGPGNHVVPCPLEHIPIFMKSGTALPLCEVQKSTKSAHWKDLTWHISLADNISGKVYLDSGDGPLNGITNEITGTFDGKTLQIQQKNSKETCNVQIGNVSKPSKINTTFSYCEETKSLEFRMESSETNIYWE